MADASVTIRAHAEADSALRPDDLHGLAASFITSEIASRAKLRRVANREGAEMLGRKMKAGTSYSGVVFPYFLPPHYESPREYRIRRDQPDLESIGDTVKERGKYLSPPGMRNMIYFPPGVSQGMLEDSTLPVIITEGEKKALALARVASSDYRELKWRFLPIALSGVWNFRGTVGKTTSANGNRVDLKGSIPDLDVPVWHRREVMILFDSNVRSNVSVKAARGSLGEMLIGRGAKILYVELPEGCGVNGIDDYLAGVEKEKGVDAAMAAAITLLKSAFKPAKTKNPTPVNFQLIRDGENAGLFFVDDDGQRDFVSSPIEVVGETQTAKGENYGRLLRWDDSKGRVKTWAMPIELVHGESSELIRYLASMGLKIGTTRKHYERLRTYINLSEPPETIICTNRIGWHEQAYVLPDECFGAGENIAFQSESVGFHKYNVKGTLDDWQANISRFCEGNSRLTFAVAAAFAAPLLPILDVPGGGIHFRGTTSTGKTTALLVAGSVFGGSDDPTGYCQTWRATANGLESICELHNHALLCLDEIGECDAKQIGDVAYMIANGQGKSRMTRTISVRRPITWQLLFLSTGEQTLADKMEEAGFRIKGGQEIRLCDVEADTGRYGVFEDLNGFPDGQALSDHLRQASKRYYGVAIREFLRRFVALDLVEVRARWRRFHESFQSKTLPEPTVYPSEIRRVATRFALVAFAGELATELGITRWSRWQAVDAVKKVFRVWKSGRPGSGGSDAENAVRQVRAFLESHGQSRFQSLRVENQESEKIVNRVGFKRVKANSEETEFLIFPESFRREVCNKLHATSVVKELKRRGLLLSDSGAYQKTERLPGIGIKKMYVVSSKIFDEAENILFENTKQRQAVCNTGNAE